MTQKELSFLPKQLPKKQTHEQPLTKTDTQTTNILSVQQLNGQIKTSLKTNPRLQNILVRGEISNLTIHSSGHIYFSLKDEESQIKCIMFKYQAIDLKFQPEHGMKIIIEASIDVYEPRGEYSLIVKSMQPDGEGALNIAFKQLKNKLEKQGLFADHKKKPIPKYPKQIAIITSPTGAAIQDITNVLRRRYPIVKIIIIPAIVQGPNAEESVIKSLQIAQSLKNIDTILMTRGGGSKEDLWCFNSETLAHNIAKSNTPIITGIGHEIDFTIADFVADKRAPTPSAAAELITPDSEEILFQLTNKQTQMKSLIDQTIRKYKDTLQYIQDLPFFKNPIERITQENQKLTHITYKFNMILENNIQNKQQQANILNEKLKALNPTEILQRGYSITTKDNEIVKNTKQVNTGDDIQITLGNGKITAKITNIEHDR
ncbi:MAG: exodeoxyribonuclease VII large subunit [Patescibacteria group bacterium]|jgi:exodeoxyribonuclease VII large subunit